MQCSNEKNSSESFERTYKALCRKKNMKPLPAVQMYLQKNFLRFCADHITLQDWPQILSSITQDRSLSKICVYSRCRCKRIREKLDTEEKVAQARTCTRNGQQHPILYTNFLLRSLIYSIAICLKESLMITSLVLDGIPLASKYLKILTDGLTCNQNLQNLSLARCRIGDEGCDMLLESLQDNSNLRVLDLSSCCLTNRTAAMLSLFLKKRKTDLLQNISLESTLSKTDACTGIEEGLQVLILDKNRKFNDVALRQLTRVLKQDFWLNTLCLRYCGITQHGGEIALELLQVNKVLTHIDLRDNEILPEMLHTIRRVLERRKVRGERLPTKKRSSNARSHSKHGLGQEIISKQASSDCIMKNDAFLKRRVHSKLKMKCVTQVSQSAHTWKTRRKNNRKCKSRSESRKSPRDKWTNANDLKKSLMLMIEGNQNLVMALENNNDCFIKERDSRLNAEQAYKDLQPHLQNLRNKINMQNSIQSGMCYENQVYMKLRNVFNELETSIEEKKSETPGKSLEKADENDKKIIVHYHKNQQPYRGWTAETAHGSHMS